MCVLLKTLRDTNRWKSRTLKPVTVFNRSGSSFVMTSSSVLPKVREVHERWDAGRELDQLFLDLHAF